MSDAAPGGVSLAVVGGRSPDERGDGGPGDACRAAGDAARRPARYLNAGLEDQERALARRG